MDEKTHYIIPNENVRKEPFDKRGFTEPYIRESYEEHGKSLLRSLSAITSCIRENYDYEDIENTYFEVISGPEIKVKSAKLKIEELGFKFISYSKEDEHVVVARINKTDITQLETKIYNYAYMENHPNRSSISYIEQFKDIAIESKLSDKFDFDRDEDVESVIVTLYSDINNEAKVRISHKIKEYLEKNDIQCEIDHFVNGMTTLSFIGSLGTIKTALNRYSSVQEICKNNIAIIEQSMNGDPLPKSITVNTVESHSIIAIVDDGIEPSNNIMSPVVVGRVPYYPAGYITSPNNHGTFVASRCVFGDNIDECVATNSLTPYCNVLDVPVFGIDFLGNCSGPSENHLMKVLENIVINNYQRIKVYNLSLGFDVAIDDLSYSKISKLMDFLQKEYDVIFVIAAGNIRSKLGSFPEGHFKHRESRINSPAESLLGITVGSIAKYEASYSLATINEPSPFTRIGPGADNGMKPEIVSHGGNLNTSYVGVARIGTYGISKDGLDLAIDNGTSFSAPLVSQYAQRLIDKYAPRNMNLIKALLYHFTNERNTYSSTTVDAKKFTGFGEPNIEAALHAGNNSGAYIYEGEIDNNNYDYIKFHIPSMLDEENPDSKLKIRATLVYNPSVNCSDDVEYSDARMTMALIKSVHDGKMCVSTTAEEKYNLPWNPIIKVEKSFTRSYCTGEWFVKTRLYTRNVNDSYIQKYALIIEVIDENCNIDVYKQISNEFGDIYRVVVLHEAA